MRKEELPLNDFEKALIDLLCEALPYVEMAELDDCYKESGKKAIKALANKMRGAIQHADQFEEMSL